MTLEPRLSCALTMLESTLPSGAKKIETSIERRSLFFFKNLQDLLIALRDGYPMRKTRFTLQQLAVRWGYRSPRAVAMVIKGQRLPSVFMLQAVERELNLSTTERYYLNLLVQKEKVLKKSGNTEAVFKEIDRLGSWIHDSFFIDLQQFSYIADWYHVVIKQMVETPNFREDPILIAERLQNKITPAQAERALTTMLSLGVLERDRFGKVFVPTTRQNLRTSNDVPTLALRRFHAQMMQRAVEALVSQDVSAREMTGLVARIDKEKVPEAKKVLREFMADFNHRFANDNSCDVYQLSVQFFSHTAS